jgi:hypothetical protein
MLPGDPAYFSGIFCYSIAEKACGMTYLKMIENWLLLPVVILFLCSFGFAGQTLDFHFHDTYFIFEGQSTVRYIAGFLLIIFGLYKTIRHRHKSVNQVFALSHILISVLLIGIMLLFFDSGRQYIDYSSFSYSKWYKIEDLMQWTIIAGQSFLLAQVIFFLYFIVQLLKKPVLNSR